MKHLVVEKLHNNHILFLIFLIILVHYLNYLNYHFPFVVWGRLYILNTHCVCIAKAVEELNISFVCCPSCIIGWQVIWNVSASLHTPLMSVTNAISGIIVIGGMIHLSEDQILLPAIAVLIATINIVGGFLVTHRMLGMFRK